MTLCSDDPECVEVGPGRQRFVPVANVFSEGMAHNRSCHLGACDCEEGISMESKSDEAGMLARTSIMQQQRAHAHKTRSSRICSS